MTIPSPLDPIMLASAFLVVINLAGFLLFAWDKYCARQGRWRVKERTLLLLAALGGSIGIIAGQRMLRHKTRKQPFRTYLAAIVIMQIVLVAAMFFPAGRDFIKVVFDVLVGAAEKSRQ
ncbi:MAG: DUF1294 domain-containing protein [Rhizobiaceae bacterium]|nr:DUF1294 domain-containing protein [Rhizobiaceae bacterium]